MASCTRANPPRELDTRQKVEQKFCAPKDPASLTDQASLESQEYQNTCYGYGEQFYQNNGYGNGEYYQVNCYGAQVQANMSPYYMIGGYLDEKSATSSLYE